MKAVLHEAWQIRSSVATKLEAAVMDPELYSLETRKFQF